MINKVFCPLPGLSLFISLLCVSQILFSQTNELGRILINEFPIPNIEKSDWIKERATIKILGTDNETRIIMTVTLDSGTINITLSQNYQAKVFVNNQLHDSLFIKLPNKIKKYKIGLKLDKPSGSRYVFLEAKTGNKLKLRMTDLLIIPIVFKLLKQPFRWLFPNKVKIQIFKDET